MTYKLRRLIWLILPVVLIGLSIPAYYLAKSIRFDTDAPEADFPAPASVAEARAQDIEQLAMFFDLERSWVPATLAEAKKQFEQLKADAPNLSDAAFDLRVARIVATADNAHTKVREYGRTPKYNRLPVRGHWFDDGYYIVRAYRGFEHLLGKRLEAIDGNSVAKLREELRQYVGGNTETFNKYLPYLLESPQLLHAAGLVNSPDGVSLTLVNNDGTGEMVTLDEPFPSSTLQIARSHLLLAPQVYSQSEPDWKTIHDVDAELPLYLQAPFEQFQFVQRAESNFSYLQFWSNSDSGDTSIKKFCQDSLASYRRNPTRVLVIDQRFNSGGNYHHTADCLTDLGRSVPADGRLYVVVDGPTFSAGITSAAIAVVAAGDRATIIGSPVGDRLISWGEDNLLTLPNSGIEIKFSTGKHDLVNGCSDWRQCYWGGLFSDLRIESLTPDIAVPLNYDDYLKRRDPVMETIRGLPREN